MHLRKLFLFGSFLGLFFGLLLFSPKKVLAQTCPQQWTIVANGTSTTVNYGDTPTLLTATDKSGLDSLIITFTLSGLQPGDEYYFYTDDNNLNDYKKTESITEETQTFTRDLKEGGFLGDRDALEAGLHVLKALNRSATSTQPICTFHYKIEAVKRDCPCSIIITSTIDPKNDKTLTPNTSVTFSGRAWPDLECGERVPSWLWRLTVTNDRYSPYTITPNTSGLGGYSEPAGGTGRYSPGTYFVTLQGGIEVQGVFAPSVICHNNFTIRPEGGDSGTSEEGTTAIKDICVDVKESEAKGECQTCFTAGKTWTALGCIPTNDLNKLVAWLLSRLIFIATGIAFILLVIGALQILTSAGNPEKVKAGSELLTSTISGLLLIILSLFLLRLIGVDILQIPGFAK